MVSAQTTLDVVPNVAGKWSDLDRAECVHEDERVTAEQRHPLFATASAADIPLG